MKKSLLKAGFFALLFTAVGSLKAQLEPYFEMTLYFEDAIGNQDSVVFGYDIDATSDLDEEWGEYEITTPFNSVFDVRIGHPSSFEEKLTKRLITRTGVFVNDTSCFDGSAASIYIHAINQPIKIWWNKMPLLNNECFRGAYLINHILHELASPIEPNEIPPLFYCMAAVDTAYFDLSEEIMTMSEWPVLSIQEDVEGQGEQTIYGLRLNVVPSWSYTPCYWVTEVNDIVRIDKISLFPNPTMDIITPILTNEINIEEAIIYDSMGRLVWKGQKLEHAEEIDLSLFASGLYRIKIYSSKNEVFIGSFMKK